MSLAALFYVLVFAQLSSTSPFDARAKPDAVSETSLSTEPEEPYRCSFSETATYVTLMNFDKTLTYKGSIFNSILNAITRQFQVEVQQWAGGKLDATIPSNRFNYDRRASSHARSKSGFFVIGNTHTHPPISLRYIHVYQILECIREYVLKWGVPSRTNVPVLDFSILQTEGNRVIGNGAFTKEMRPDEISFNDTDDNLDSL